MTNINKYIQFILCLTLSSCIFITSYGRDFKRAHNEYLIYNYDKSLDYCITSLKRNPNFEKALKLYEKVIPLAMKSHYSSIDRTLNNNNNANGLRVSVEHFKNLYKLIEKLEKASISDSYQSYIKQDYTEKYEQTLEKAAHYHYKKGLDYMSLKDKKNYKLAYNEFILSDHYINNYKDSQKHIKECKNNSVFNITIMDFENNSRNKYHVSGNALSNKLISDLSNNISFIESVSIIDRKNLDILIEQLKISTSGLVGEQLLEIGKIKDIDHIVRGEINKVIVNEPKKTTEKTKIKNQDNKWGSTVKKNHQIEAFALIEIYLEIIDVETSEIINSETFTSEISYIDTWTTGESLGSGSLLADIALTVILNNQSKKERRQVSSEEILNNAINQINNKMTSYLLKFYQ